MLARGVRLQIERPAEPVRHPAVQRDDVFVGAEIARRQVEIATQRQGVTGAPHVLVTDLQEVVHAGARVVAESVLELPVRTFADLDAHVTDGPTIGERVYRDAAEESQSIDRALRIRELRRVEELSPRNR